MTLTEGKEVKPPCRFRLPIRNSSPRGQNPCEPFQKDDGNELFLTQRREFSAFLVAAYPSPSPPPSHPHDDVSRLPQVTLRDAQTFPLSHIPAFRTESESSASRRSDGKKKKTPDNQLDGCAIRRCLIYMMMVTMK